MGKLSTEQKSLIDVSLGNLLKKYQGEEGIAFVKGLLSSFSCDKDNDIESFLHNRAIEFELLNKGRTHLICDKDKLQTEGQFVILGFFTVALKVLGLPADLSNNKRKELDGFSAKLRGEVITAIPCYLIGQLAKNSAVKDEINGSVLIDNAIFAIEKAAEIVGGRYVLIECHETPYLRKFYTDNGFVEFEQIPDKGVPVVQMLRPIYEI